MQIESSPPEKYIRLYFKRVFWKTLNCDRKDKKKIEKIK